MSILSSRDERKPVVPYGVGFDYDIVNKPPVAEPPLGVPETDVLTIGELLLHRHSPNFSTQRAMSK